MPSNNSEHYSTQPKFSRLYIEEDIREHPRTKEICNRFPKATQIPISSYKEVFNRSRQPWRMQKESLQLILAEKKDGFLYEGSFVAPDFGYEHFYYNSLILNCLFDCEYCYLQGMYPSAHCVIFVNLEDYFHHTDLLLKKKSPVYLCISYDTDLLGFESIIPYASQWIEYARTRPELIIELRTKSAGYSLISKQQPLKNVVLAWTISPQEIIDRHEPKTPSLKRRLQAAKQAIEDGWQVRLCLDPILYTDNFESIYDACIETLSTHIDISRIYDCSLGVFRINQGYLQNIRKQRPDSSLIQFPYTKHDKTASYSEMQKSTLLGSIEAGLRRIGVPQEKITRS